MNSLSVGYARLDHCIPRVPVRPPPGGALADYLEDPVRDVGTPERGGVESVVANGCDIRVGAPASIVALDVVETQRRQRCRCRGSSLLLAGRTALSARDIRLRHLRRTQDLHPIQRRIHGIRAARLPLASPLAGDDARLSPRPPSTQQGRGVTGRSTDRDAGNRRPRASSCTRRPPRRASDAGLRHTSYGTRTRLRWRAKACRWS